MGYSIAWAAFVIALIIIVIILSRKFMILANIEVDQIQSEKNAQLKQHIMANQVRRRFSHLGFLFARFLRPFFRLLRNGFDRLYDALRNWQRLQANREATLEKEIDRRIELLLLEAEGLAKEERYDAAEKKYIEIIGLDSLNFRAFRELGEVYFHKHLLKESIQTLEHALNLRRGLERGEHDAADATLLEIAQARYLLATVYEEAGELETATVNLKRALKIEESNPRYLDRLIEVSILRKDKIEALNAWERLERTNPENQKLAQFKGRIAEL